MKYLIYFILISSFIGFVTYATIETNKQKNSDQNISAVSNANTNISSVDTPTVIIPSDISPTNNVIQKSPTRIRYEDNEREDD